MMANRIYNIPLRKEVRKAPKYMRANKAIRAIKKFLKRHVKEDVKIGKYLNHKVLEHGRKNVPHHVEVEVFKKSKGEKDKKEEYYLAELVGAPKEEEKQPEKKEEKKQVGEKSEEKESEKEVKKKVLEKGEEKKEKPEVVKKKRDVNIGETLKQIIRKDEKPSKETKLSKE